jgi:hypothetical protein
LPVILIRFAVALCVFSFGMLFLQFWGFSHPTHDSLVVQTAPSTLAWSVGHPVGHWPDIYPYRASLSRRFRSRRLALRMPFLSARRRCSLLDMKKRFLRAEESIRSF